MSARGPPALEEKRAVRFRAGGMTTLFKAESILKTRSVSIQEQLKTF